MHEENFVFTEVDASLHAESIVSMFNECFSREVSIEQFKWKYLKSYPEKVRTWAAIEKNTGRHVGYYSAFKMNFFSNRKNHSISRF